MPCGLLFDLDGLMLDSERFANQSWREAAQAHGVDLADEVLQAIIGRNALDTDHIISAALPKHINITTLRQQRDAALLHMIRQGKIPEKPGLRDVLTHFKHLPKAVATSSSRALATAKLNMHSLATHFDAIITGDDASPGKPDPAIYRAAIAALSLNAQDCLALEDSQAGVESALGAGLSVIAIPDLQPVNIKHARLTECNALTESIPLIQNWVDTHA